MNKQNHTKFAILGVLTTDCHTGYSIKQMIDESLNHFWKISYGQIYPILKQLVKDGLASVVEKPQEDKPDKREYYLTTKGHQALQEWLQEPLKTLPREKNEVLLKLFFSRHQDNDATLQLLNQYLSKLEATLATYEAIEQMLLTKDGNQEDVPYWLFTLDYGKRTTQAALEWCHDTITELNKV